MERSEAHKQAAATLRRIAAKIDAFTPSEATQLARIAETQFRTLTAMHGKMRSTTDKRGRKLQDGKTLTEIMTPTAPTDLPTMVSRWAQEIAELLGQSNAPYLLATLAIALVELDYLPGDKYKQLYFTLMGAIPADLQKKFGEISTFRNRLRCFSNPKLYPDREEYSRQIEATKEYFKAP